MKTLVQILSELTGLLRLPDGVPATSLAELRRKIAAILILGDPELVPVPDDPAADPLLQQAAKAGELLAQQWQATGIQMRYVEEPYLVVETEPERPVDVIGPFVSKDLTLVQYAFYQPTKFLIVKTAASNIALLPLATVKDAADATKWNIPKGSVWVAANRLVQGGFGWAGLTVSGGTLVATPVNAGADVVQVDPTKPWTLTITPEPAPAAGGISDGDAAAVTLPTQLQVSASAPVVTGPLELAAFNTTLKFTTRTGAASRPSADTIRFPYATGNAAWQIPANRVRLFSLTLASTPVANPAWVLPVTPRALQQLGEVRHGGSLAFELAAGPRSQVVGTVRESRWEKTFVNANARGIEIRTDKAASDITMDLALWGQSRTTAKISDIVAAVTVRHASRRGGADIATFTRGRVANNWDRPRAASGTPFEYEGRIELLTFITERTTPARRLVLQASRTADQEATQGYALENFYLHTTPAGRMSLVGSGSTASRLTEGHARLIFDVRIAQPMLPHPYAANWDVDQGDFANTRSALSATVRWPNVNSPVMESALLAQVRLPPPATVDDPERSFLYLLDVSGRDDQLGVILDPFDPTLPSIEQNRLVWPMKGIALTMLPQVLWEPVQLIEQPLT